MTHPFGVQASACPDNLKVELQTADGFPVAHFANEKWGTNSLAHLRMKQAATLWFDPAFGKPTTNRPLIGRMRSSPPKGSRKARKSALDAENSQGQAYRMSTGKNQFFFARGSVKGKSYDFED